MGDERDKPQPLRRVPAPMPPANLDPAVRDALEGIGQAQQAQQEATAAAIDSGRGGPLAGGVEISFTLDGSNAASVAHKLGRRWSRWVIVSKSATADIWEDTQTDATKFLTLNADAAVTIKVVVN